MPSKIFLDKFMEKVREKNPHQPEFQQAVEEVLEHLIPYLNNNEKYRGSRILDRIIEPDRIIQFRVTWLNDKNEVQVNRGYRVQYSNAIGPYKGGLRFHPSVDISVLKFLAFEQVFKNSLTDLPMGGAKGGADFNPKDKSRFEIMRFCQAFMLELQRYIGSNTDVPAGDIGVSTEEIGFMYGMYKKINLQHTGVMTGKGLEYGGSMIRPEATGYGLVYFVEKMLERLDEEIEGKKVLISGSGNVAQYAAEKIIHLKGRVLTLSDSDGFIYDKDGLNEEKIEYVKDLKNIKKGRIREYKNEYPEAEYYPDQTPWSVPADIALPCATQNEIKKKDAKKLIKNGVKAVGEGANMPTTIEAKNIFHDAHILYAPGKASNAGGVATSGLEMSQNSQHIYWTRSKVDDLLKEIMSDIHDKCVNYGRNKNKNYIDYSKGANIAGFVKVADAMINQGIT